jgi:hypothetical protein
VRFSHCDGGLIAHGGIAEGFAVAGEDRVFRSDEWPGNTSGRR